MDLGQQRTLRKRLASSISSKMVFPFRGLWPFWKGCSSSFAEICDSDSEDGGGKRPRGCRERCDNSLTFQNLPGLLSHGKFIHVTNICLVSLASKVLC